MTEKHEQQLSIILEKESICDVLQIILQHLQSQANKYGLQIPKLEVFATSFRAVVEEAKECFGK